MHGSLPKKDSIQKLAASCLQEANNDAIRATDDMTRLVLDSPKLYRSLMDPLVRERLATTPSAN